ncbi:MAG: TonB-dependent receptor plug domain-containing protein [Myxococcota bacterium]
MSPIPTAALLALLALGGADRDDDEGRTVIRDDPRLLTPSRVVTREQLTEPGATASEVLSRQPGATTTDLGGPAGTSTVRIRGSRPEHVRVFLDGVPLENADGSVLDLGELPLWQADRLDLWRSHAPLGKGGGIGGALEVTSRHARGGVAEVATEAGAFGTLRTGVHGGWADEEGRGDLSLSAEALRSAGDFEWADDRGTLFEEGDDRTATRRNNDVRRLVGLLSGGLEAGPCRVGVLDHVLSLERGLPGPATSPATRVRHRRTSQLGAVRVRCSRGRRWSVRGLLAVRWQRTETGDPWGELYQAPSEATRDALGPSARLTATVGLLPWLGLGLHGEVRHERFLLRDDLRPEEDTERRRLSTGLAAEAPVQIDALDLRLAPRVRLDTWDAPDARGRAAVTWQAAAAWTGLADAGLRVRTAVGTAVRAPDLFELYGDGATVLPSPDLEAERGLTATGAVAWTIPWLPVGWWVDLEVAAFASRMDDLIQLRRNTRWSAVAENVEGARIRGVEWTVRADLLRHLRARWSHTSLRTRSTSAGDGGPLPLRPVASNHARLEGYVATPTGSEVRAWADVDHVGSNTYDAAGLVRAPARWLLGLGVGGRWVTHGLVGAEGELEAGVIVRNVLDRHEVDLAGYPLPGRAWSIRLAWRERVF